MTASFQVNDAAIDRRRRRRPPPPPPTRSSISPSFFLFFLLISLVPSFSPVKSGDWNEFFFSIFCARPAHRRRRRGGDGGGGGGGGSSFFFLSTHRALSHQIRFLMDPFYGSPLFFVSLTFFLLSCYQIDWVGTDVFRFLLSSTRSDVFIEYLVITFVFRVVFADVTGFYRVSESFFFLGATGGPCHCDEPMKEKGKTTHRHVNENESGGSRASFVFWGFFFRVYRFLLPDNFFLPRNSDEISVSYRLSFVLFFNFCQYPISFSFFMLFISRKKKNIAKRKRREKEANKAI